MTRSLPQRTAAARLFILACIAIAAYPAKGGELKQFETRNYIIQTDLPPDDVRPLALHMDAVYDEYKARFVSGGVGRERGPGKENLYLLSTREAYISFMSGVGISAENSGGMFFNQENASGLATWVYDRSRRNILQVLQHEGFHQFAQRFLGNELPVWINEGLAEYFEQARLVKGRFKIGVAEPQRISLIKNAVEKGEAFAAADLMSITSEKWHANMNDPALSALQYTQSWSLCHFLIHADRARYQNAFIKYLDLIGNGRERDRAFETAFGTKDPAALEAKWKQYVLKDLKPDDYSIMLDRMEFLCDAAQFLKTSQPLPDTFDAFKELIKGMAFRMTYGDFEIAATDDSNYHYLDSKGNELPFEYMLDAATGLPIFSAGKANPRAAVRWIRIGDALEYEVVFK